MVVSQATIGLARGEIQSALIQDKSYKSNVTNRPLKDLFKKKICKKHRKKLCRNSCAWYTLRQKWNLFQPIRSTLSSDTSLVRLSWYEISTLVSQTLFRGGTSSGVEKRRPFSGQQTINIKAFNTLCFLGIFSYVTIYYCYRALLQKVLQNLFFQKKWGSRKI